MVKKIFFNFIFVEYDLHIPTTSYILKVLRLDLDVKDSSVTGSLESYLAEFLSN